MCGIAGEFALDPSRRVDTTRILPMASALGHRGPDGWGYYTDPHGRVALINLRLAIVDLVGGQQPIPNEDATVWVSVNGEIYEDQRLRRELQARGHRFRSCSDSEVVVHLYEEYGEEFVTYLRGEFAFALFDERQSKLLLVRDRFGIKPLFYAQNGATLVFASEIKSIFRHGAVAPEFDPPNLYCYLCTLPLPGETIFRKVKQVEPGCYLALSDRGIRIVRYWDLPLPPDEAELRDSDGSAQEQNLCDEFKARFEEAVWLRLRADVPVATYLSGGIDSSCVTAVAARAAPLRMRAFTVGFEDENYDETGKAAQVALAVGVDHHVVRIRRSELASSLVDAVWHGEIPIFNAHVAAKFLLSKFASSHTKVVLTGEGADELLRGYSQFKHQALLEEVRRNPHDMMARTAIRDFLHSAGHLAGVTSDRSYRLYQHVLERFGSYPYAILRALKPRRLLPFFLSRDFREEVRSFDPVDHIATKLDRAQVSRRSPLSASQYFMFKTDLPNYVLNVLGDRMEMAHSLEGRVPFLDHLLVELVCRLPVSLQLRGMVDKYVLRKTYASIYGSALEPPPKKVFLAPSLQVRRHCFEHPELQELLSTRSLRQAGVFNVHTLNGVRTALDLMPSASNLAFMGETLITGVLSVQILNKVFCRDFSSFSASKARELGNPNPAGPSL